MAKKVALITLGCKLNFAESAAVAGEFKRGGYEEVSSRQVADLYIINSCSVTEHSDKKCRNFIRKVHKLNPKAEIFVTGCYAQLKAKEVSKIEGVTAVFGQHEKAKIFSFAQELFSKPTNTQPFTEAKIITSDIFQSQEVFPAGALDERTRAFVKVQDGCDYFCTYCTIPFARGHSRSIAPEILIKQAQMLALQGVKEVVLTGVNIGDYHFNGESSCDFLTLLKLLNEVEGVERYRISSIEPNLLTNTIIDHISSSALDKFQPHFHIPLQSGCNSILKRMNRRYTTEFFERKIDYIRSKMGDIFLGIDVIVGFPGEGEEDFKATYNFLCQRIKPAFIHIFPYSKREGTLACRMPNQVSESVKTERVKALEELCAKLHEEYIARYRGTTQKVLFESKLKEGLISGYTANYIRVARPYDKSLIGKIIDVTI